MAGGEEWNLCHVGSDIEHIALWWTIAHLTWVPDVVLDILEVWGDIGLVLYLFLFVFLKQLLVRFVEGTVWAFTPLSLRLGSKRRHALVVS